MRSFVNAFIAVIVVVMVSLPAYAASSVSYTITADATAGGKISPSGAKKVAVTSKNQVTYTIAPSTGYMIDDVLVNGTSVGAVTTYSFTPSTLTGDCTIHAVFTSIGSNVSGLEQTTLSLQQSMISLQQTVSGLAQSVSSLQNASSAKPTAADITIDRTGTSLVSATTVQEAFAESGINNSYVVGGWTTFSNSQDGSGFTNVQGVYVFNADGTYYSGGSLNTVAAGTWALANGFLTLTTSNTSNTYGIGGAINKNLMQFGNMAFGRSVFTEQMVSGKTIAYGTHIIISFNADGTATSSGDLVPALAPQGACTWAVGSDGVLTVSSGNSWTKFILAQTNGTVMLVNLIASNGNSRLGLHETYQ